MKRRILAIAALLVTAGLAAPAQAANPKQLKQLLETNACKGCDLSNAQLSRIVLIGADLSNARLNGAKLMGASLRDVQLDGADLVNANLTQTDLSGANLSGANLSGARLDRSDLSGVNLGNANLTGTNLSQANLSRANLNNANLSQANLRGTKLTGANLTGSIGLAGQPAPGVSNKALEGDLSAQPPENKQIQPPPPPSSIPSELEEGRSEDLRQQPPTPTETVTPPAAKTKPSPLERPLTRLFGFETATPLQEEELVLYGGGISFESPNNSANVFGGGDNRDNDVQAGADYGITDTLQFSIGVGGKDDTVYSNLVGNQTGLQFLYSAIPAQLKWQVYDDNRLSTAVVVGAEFPSPFTAIPSPNTLLINEIDDLSGGSSGRKIIFTTNPEGLLAAENAFIAEDNSIILSLAVPISYQLTDQARLHLNPQLSFFPSNIPVTYTQGNPAALTAANVGFDGDELDYYGTVAGIGFGFDYSLSPRVQLTADVTPILAGDNSADSGGDNSLFVARPVWNAGLRVALNSRLGVNIYATNRFGPNTASPSNLLVQPGDSWGVGLDLIYLPDLTGSYEIPMRDSYPEAQTFLSPLNGFPSATLPINSVIYQLGYGTPDQIIAMARIGVLDDLELVLSRSSLSVPQIPIEYSAIGRLALLPDDGKREFTAAAGAGVLFTQARDGNDAIGLAAYADLPVSYNYRELGLNLTVTPKAVIQVDPLGCDTCPPVVGSQTRLGITLGGTWNVAKQTQLLAEFTPILVGDNQLQSNGLQGKTSLYNVGIRQLFPRGNSLYALDLYVGNSAGESGFQGISALPDGEVQVGLRFNILNGVPQERE